MDPAASSAKAELLAAGTRVGRYHLLQRLAVGGMAELHLACAEGLAGFQKVVVVKRVLPHLALDPDFVRLFLNEARLAATLDHPNIVHVTDIGESDGDYFYVMEYVHGTNARELLRASAKADRLPIDVALAIGIGAASGLHHAHQATDLAGDALGLVHRDVSPANLLVSYDGAVKLTDFGIAKAAARTEETIGGAVKGKIGYMSPEQCRGERVDRRSDVFALGVVLFELTTCERLFYADNDFAILNKVITGSFDAPSVRVPDYPPELEAIVLKALATDPVDRYDSADEVRQDLESFAHEHRLRVSPATVAAWMKTTLGIRPYPRVELAPIGETQGPVVPTLVYGSPPGESIAAAVQTVIADASSEDIRAPAVRGGRWLLVAGLATLAGAVGLWISMSQVDPVPIGRVPAEATGVAEPSVDASPRRAETPALAAPAASAGLTGVAPADTSPPAGLVPGSPAGSPPEERPPGPAAPRRRKAKKRKKPRGSARDMDALYPVEG